MRIGIMSFAHHHAEAYITVLQAMRSVEVIGIADDDAERGQRAAAQFNAHLFPGYKALLAENPDGVIICSENTLHLEMVEMAAMAGAHILCEKPIATTLEDCRAEIAACDAAGVRLMTAFPMRFHPAAAQVKNALDNGEFGKVYCCNTTNQGENPNYIRSWFTDKKLAGGGAAMDHTVHVADMLRWYLKAEVVEVYAEIDNLLHRDRLDIDTAGLLMLTFDNGVFATLDCSWSRPAYYPAWGNVKIDLVCERGVLRTDYFAQRLTVYNHDKQRPVWSYWGSDVNAAMVSEFVASIRENREPSVTGNDGMRAVEVALAAYRSAEAHQPVRLA